MKVALVVVGKAKGAVGEAIEQYDARARRYFSFESHAVKEEAYRGRLLIHTMPSATTSASSATPLS